VAHPSLTGVLLVGGASRRFGSPKALAQLAGETLAERGWRVLGEACDERFAVGKAADGLALPFPLLDDGTPVRHPAAGIVAALRAAANEVSVVLPVDCVSMTAAALRALGEACADTDAAVPAGGWPLPGAFRRTALPALERCLADSGSLMGALASLEVRRVPLDPRLTADVDTPEELGECIAAERPELRPPARPLH
jgi:molybdenum cofactor guanylyltransferase